MSEDCNLGLRNKIKFGFLKIFLPDCSVAKKVWIVTQDRKQDVDYT